MLLRKTILQPINVNIDAGFISKMLPYLSITNTILPRVLCIDEFKGNSCQYKYQVALLDGETQKIADHFHWARYACNALDKIRIEVQSNLPKSERKYFKHAKYLLQTRRCNLKENRYDELENILINYSSSDSVEIKKLQFTEYVKRNLE